MTASYTYYQNLHPDVKQLDLMSHTPSVQYALKLTDRITTATYYNYAYYFLSGSSFVTQNRIGSLTTFRANDRWDLTGGTNYANANFRGAAFLNSDNYAGTLEATRYTDEARNNYVKVGYGAGYSDAALSGFTYMVNNGYIVTRILYGNENRNEATAHRQLRPLRFQGARPDPTDDLSSRQHLQRRLILRTQDHRQRAILRAVQLPEEQLEHRATALQQRPGFARGRLHSLGIDGLRNKKMADRDLKISVAFWRTIRRSLVPVCHFAAWAPRSSPLGR